MAAPNPSSPWSAAPTGSNSSSTGPWRRRRARVFYYNSGNSHLLSAILSKVTGKSALDYARETLFGPLGIEDVLWRGRPAGRLGRRRRPLPAAARHGEDRLSLAARRRCGRASRSCRRRGSRACARPMSTCARAGRGTCATAASSGSCRAATPIIAVGYHRQLIVVMPEARHRGGDDRLVALLHARAAWPARRATASGRWSATSRPP